MDGKDKCKVLKAIRKKLAEKNGIEFDFFECTNEGDCIGTCPKCEEETLSLLVELKKSNSTIGCILNNEEYFEALISPFPSKKEIIETQKTTELKYVFNPVTGEFEPDVSNATTKEKIKEELESQLKLKYAEIDGF